mgnify:CR=1 FL=1
MIFSFDNVPATIFSGRKHGVFNTNSANSVRTSIMVVQNKPNKQGFRISPLIRFQASERKKLLKKDILLSLIPESYQVVSDDKKKYYKCFTELTDIYNTWINNSDGVLNDLFVKDKTEYMIRSQNDVYMVTSGSVENGNDDNAEEGLKKGLITRGELLRNAANVCSVLKRSITSIRMMEGEDDIEVINPPKGANKRLNDMPYMEVKAPGVKLDLTGLKTEGGWDNVFTLQVVDSGIYDLIIRMKSDAGELSQTTMVVTQNTRPIGTETINGTNGEWIEKHFEIDSCYQRDNYISIYFAQTGIDIDSIELVQKKAWSMVDKRSSGVLC